MKHKNRTQAEWDAAKKEARKAMCEAARKGENLTYTDLVDKISTIKFSPRGLGGFLEEIATEDYRDGKVLTTVVVVRKSGSTSNEMPGDGFFDLAKRLGVDIEVSDRRNFCKQERDRVGRYCLKKGL